MKTVVNVPSKSNKHKTLKKTLFVICTDPRIRIQLPKCHGSTTLPAPAITYKNLPTKDFSGLKAPGSKKDDKILN
jgi:hypothetical protein